jgi:hypothetical protein
MDSQVHQGLDLEEAITFLLIVLFVHGHGACTQMSFCHEILKIRTPVILEAHNIFLKTSDWCEV